MREKLVMRWEYFEQMQGLPDVDRLKMYDAVVRYAFLDEEPHLEGLGKLAFDLFRPTLDKTKALSDGGKKGGKTSKPGEKVIKNLKPFKGAESHTESPTESHTESLSESLQKATQKASRKPAEVKPEAPVEAVVLNDGSEWRPTVEEYEEYKRLYPGVDVDQEFRSIRGWCMGNPSKRKTRAGVTRFVSSWLNRAQDSPRREKPAAAPAKPVNAFHNFEERTYNYDEIMNKVRRMQ